MWLASNFHEKCHGFCEFSRHLLLWYWVCWLLLSRWLSWRLSNSRLNFRGFSCVLLLSLLCWFFHFDILNFWWRSYLRSWFRFLHHCHDEIIFLDVIIWCKFIVGIKNLSICNQFKSVSNHFVVLLYLFLNLANGPCRFNLYWQLFTIERLNDHFHPFFSKLNLIIL